MAVSEDTALVGTIPLGLAPVGSAYVFVRDDKGTTDRSDDTWSQQGKLTANDAGAEDFFGRSVGLSGRVGVGPGGVEPTFKNVGSQ